MPVTKSPEVDVYIERARPFARPLLERIRRAFHRGCPTLEETIKWGVPHFAYRGLLGGMAAFKAHVGFGFWKSRLLEDPHGLFQGDPKASMCTVKVQALGDLPAQEILVDYVRRAARLNEEGVTEKRPAGRAAEPKVPSDLAGLLQGKAKARRTFEGLTPAQRRAYVEWIEDAKRSATREKRLQTTLVWLAEGKTRHWRYR